MMSIPIIDEAYETLKARNPGLDQDQTFRSRTGQLRIWVDRTFLEPTSGAPPSGRIRQRRHFEAGDGELIATF